MNDKFYLEALSTLKKRSREFDAITLMETIDGELIYGGGYLSQNFDCGFAPELLPITRALWENKVIASSITLALTDEGPIVLTPSPNCISLLFSVSSSNCCVYTPELYQKDGFQVRYLRELYPYHDSLNSILPNFPNGLGSLSRELFGIVSNPNFIEKYVDLFMSKFKEAYLKNKKTPFRQIKKHADRYLTARHLPNITLANVELSFQASIEFTISKIIDDKFDAFVSLGMNADDINRIHGGQESFRRIFSNLLVFIQTGSVKNQENPFPPFDDLILNGASMESFFSWYNHEDSDEFVNREEDTLKTLSKFLQQGKRGLISYIDQRNLFKTELFPEGTKICPFMALSKRIIISLGQLFSENYSSRGLLASSSQSVQRDESGDE